MTRPTFSLFLSWRFKEAEAPQLLRQLINIFSTSFLPQADRHHNDSFVFYSVDDSVALPNRAQASIARKILGQRLTLFCGFLCEAVYAFLYYQLNSAIGNVAEHPSRLRSDFDLVRQD